MLCEVPHQFVEAQAQAVSEAPGQSYANLPLASLDEPDLGSMDVGDLGQRLLREPLRFPELAHPVTKGQDPIAVSILSPGHRSNLFGCYASVDYEFVADCAPLSLRRTAMDLFGNERKRLRGQLRELRSQQQSTSDRAAERQDRVVELERIIEDLRAEVHSSRSRGASNSEISAVEQALQDAMAIHGESTR